MRHEFPSPMSLTAGPLRLRECWQLAGGPNVPAARGLMPPTRWQVFRRIRLLRTLGPSWTVYADGALLAGGGLAETVPGVAEGWTVVLPIVGRRALGFRLVRFVQRFLAAEIRVRGYHRVWACCPAYAREITGWLHGLGFAAETRLARATADGQDVLVFVILPEGNHHGS